MARLVERSMCCRMLVCSCPNGGSVLQQPDGAWAMPVGSLQAAQWRDMSGQ
jgi:hypothetical protein